MAIRDSVLSIVDAAGGSTEDVGPRTSDALDRLLDTLAGEDVSAGMRTSDVVAAIAEHVSGGSGPAPTLISKTITANGAYAASDDGADGYDSVLVDIETTWGAKLSVQNISLSESINVWHCTPEGKLTATSLAAGNSNVFPAAWRTQGSYEFPASIVAVTFAKGKTCTLTSHLVDPVYQATYAPSYGSYDYCFGLLMPSATGVDTVDLIVSVS